MTNLCAEVSSVIMAKSPEVKVAVFGRAGVGKSGKSETVFQDSSQEDFICFPDF